LIAGTLAFLPMSIVADSVGAGGFGPWALLKTAFGIFLIVVIAYLLGRRRRYHVPLAHLATEHAEISPIAALAYGLAGTIVFGVLGLTGALGAFVVGLLLSGSLERGVFASSLAPLRAAAKLIFFAAFGALVDIDYVFSHLLTIALGLLAIILARLAATTWLMQFAGAPLPRAFVSSAALWPAGETSFLLVVGAFSTYALGVDEAKFAMALIAATILTSPVALAMTRRVRASVDLADWRSLGTVILGRSPQPAPAAANMTDIGAQVREAAGLYGDPAPPQRPPDPHA
jgi:Kef-type K+ transport system membrane component KefB